LLLLVVVARCCLPVTDFCCWYCCYWLSVLLHLDR
jgi:hypothetical protein